MSVCTFLASDVPLEEWRPSQDDPLCVNLDGSADDCFFSYPFSEVRTYTSKPFGVVLSWNGSERSARKIMEYIRMAIQKADSIELWHVWLTDYYEFEDRPFFASESPCLFSTVTCASPSAGGCGDLEHPGQTVSQPAILLLPDHHTGIAGTKFGKVENNGAAHHGRSSNGADDPGGSPGFSPRQPG